MGIPTITTSRLTLRSFVPEDSEPLHRILAEKDVLRYFPSSQPPPLDRVEKLVSNQLCHWQERGYGWWAVEPRSSSTFIGWCGLQFLPETQETEVAYLLGKEHWGRGFATEAARASLRYGFIDLGLEQIIALVHPENESSCRVVEKLGIPFAGRANYFGMELNRYVIQRPDYLVSEQDRT
jgi:ribosomal-protein-alanine N-acetyltransferase